MSKEIVSLLLKEKAVFLKPEDPFTWTSGIRSPIYCDNRLLISSPSARKTVVKQFVDFAKSTNSSVIAGTATAGIPWASWIAQELDLPLIYVRSSVKEHGRQNAIEGKLTPGSHVLLIEDLISTGKSSIAAAQRIEESGGVVDAVVSIFTYGFKETEELFQKHHFALHSLGTFPELAQVAFEQKLLDAESLQKVLKWRETLSI